MFVTKKVWRTLAVAATMLTLSYAQGYKELSTPANRLISDPNKIEVVEVFSYTCPHCYNLEPYLAKWQATKPENVEFVRLAMPGQRFMGLYAQVFFTLEAVGGSEEAHMAVFDALHKKRLDLRTKEEIAQYLSGYGVDTDQFIKNWDSFSVKMKLKRAEEMINQYQINYTPAIFVEGRYLISSETTQNGSFEDMIGALDSLIQRLTAEKSSAQTAEKQ